MRGRRTWRFLDSGPATGSENMSLDERLLRDAAQGNVLPVLRFYTWDPPAVSIGRFQDENTAVNRAACGERGIDVVRRITGGRSVLHYRELTYSVIAPSNNDLFPDDVIGTYKIIAEGLLAGLREIGLAAEMAPLESRRGGPAPTGAPACFAAPSAYELLVSGRKIIGSAQRRIAGAFLQHGSILIEYDAALDAAVIPGGGVLEAVTSITRELGHPVQLDEVKKSFLRSFARALQIEFRA
jgi:lipoate-protein ligase A